MSVSGLEPLLNGGNRRWRGAISLGVAAWALAGCAPPQTPRVSYSHGHEHFSQSKYGHASRKVVADGEPVPRGGGQYLVGRPYTVAGHRYYPAENPSYTATGMASWYGAAFHGRRTANGEVYDMASLSAAHPTMPLPSYARVTNLGNGYSVIVRVNDRGPYHAGRVMDVSSRVADVLDMKAMGTAKVKVDYVGPAPMEGSDDSQLLASLRTDGSPANMIGYSAPVMMASAAAEQTDTIWSFFSGGGRGGHSHRRSRNRRCRQRRRPHLRRSPRQSRSQARLSLRRLSPSASRRRRGRWPNAIGFRRQRPVAARAHPFRASDKGHRSAAPASALRSQPRSPPVGRGCRLVLVRAVDARLSAHVVEPPRRPELHASAERALYYSGAVRLPPKKPTGAFDRLKPSKSARADY